MSGKSNTGDTESTSEELNEAGDGHDDDKVEFYFAPFLGADGSDGHKAGDIGTDGEDGDGDHGGDEEEEVVVDGLEISQILAKQSKNCQLQKCTPNPALHFCSLQLFDSCSPY